MLLVGPSGAGKTAALREFASARGANLVNINLRLSEQLLDLTGKQRALRLPELLDGVLQDSGNPVILDNTEILFDLSLTLDPLRLLQGISRNRVVLASWNGTINDGRLRYAESGHFGFREFLRHRGEEPTAEARRWTAAERSLVENRFGEFLQVGGFPEAQGARLEDRLQLLQGYVDTVLFRDIVERHAMSQVAALRWLVRQAPRNPAGSFSVPPPGPEPAFPGPGSGQGHACRTVGVPGRRIPVVGGTCGLRVPAAPASQPALALSR